MIEDFKEQLKEAKKEAVRKYEEKLENKNEEQRKYAELYLKLVISLIRAFDYENMDIDFHDINLSDYEDIIGFPKISSKNIDDNNITVCFSYENSADGWGAELVEPDDKKIDYNILSKILNDNGVFIEKKYLETSDGWGTEDFELYLSFDSSILEIEKTKSESKKKFIKS